MLILVSFLLLPMHIRPQARLVFTPLIHREIERDAFFCLRNVDAPAQHSANGGACGPAPPTPRCHSTGPANTFSTESRRHPTRRARP